MMGSASLPLLFALLPKVPLLGKTAVWHTLGLSEHSKHWDLRTELTIRILRSWIAKSPLPPISKAQYMSLKDRGIKGRIWVSKVTLPKPTEDDIRQALFKAIEGLNEPGEAPGIYILPELLPVEAEWTGYRAGASPESVELSLTEQEKYNEMMREVTSPTTILYFHGGAYYLMDPVSHRPFTKKLAKLTHGRCLSVRYRLAPQHPFPAALLDALVVYLTLLYPLAGSYHKPVSPAHIVLAGESAGGNLSLALLQTLLELQRKGRQIIWNGVLHSVPLPAGVATPSPWLDITQSSPSCESNHSYDYLPWRSLHPTGIEYQPCPLWPTTPPRKNVYAEESMLAHPLVSPLVARSWEGSCPLYIQTGTELLSDEDKYMAMKASRQGVRVVFEEYEAMPHCFGMVLWELEGTRKFFARWAATIAAMVETPWELVTSATLVRARSLLLVPLDVTALCAFTDADVRSRMQRRVRELSAAQPVPRSKL